MGGKPNPGTSADGRLKENQNKAKPSKPKKTLPWSSQGPKPPKKG